MKIICSRSDLQKSINIVMKAIPSKTTMSILQNIMIDASKGVIHFIANDMELGIETVVEGRIDEKGKVALDAKLFSDIVRKLPDSEVIITVDNNYLTEIRCEKSKFKIPGLSGEDFPYLPYVEKDHSIAISQFTLKEVIRQTAISIAQNENNKMMSGELFEIIDNSLRVVSLDGHRISIRRIELRESYEHKKVIVPGKTLMEISKILSGEVEDDVVLYFTKNHILFEFDQTIAVSRLIEGEYFNVDKMVSNDYNTKVTINKQEFISCIDRATLFVKEGDKKPVILGADDTLLTLKIASDIGSMDEQIMIEKEGKDILIGFNPRFLLDALRVIDDEEVELYMVNSKAPCIIRDEASTYTYLILPINFNQ
ncbi:MAG: DNA polymerase III subunit beta [Eubacteriales bacterium]|nr:DNA polymerase III subunit beta [Eubacteriales bacterium]